MSVTVNSSKHSTQASSASARATGGIGIVLAHLAALQRLAVAVDAVMRVGHEVVEMDAPLAPHRHELEEHVHQHGLAAPDAAMDVEPAHRRLRCRGAWRTASRASSTSPRCRLSQISSISRSSACASRYLRRVARDLAALDQMRRSAGRPSHGSGCRRAGASVALCRRVAPGCESSAAQRDRHAALRSGRRSARRPTNRGAPARRRRAS